MNSFLKERKQKVLDFVYSNEYRIMTLKQMAGILGVPKDEIKDLEKIILNLEEDGKIYIDDSKRICIPNNSSRFVCVFETKSKGFGFARVLKEDSSLQDIYITKEYMNGAFDKDTVLVDVIKHEAGKNAEGRVVKILKREEAKFVGIVRKNDSFGFVEVINKSINDIYVPYKLLMGTENEDRVVVKITKYPTETRKAEGKIVEVLGHKNDDDIEEKSILAEHNVANKFPKNVIDEAETISEISKDDIKGRVDLRDKNIFTIDSEDAKDLDDAVCVEKVSDDEYKLSVHIADVSFYVKEDSFIDKEAIKRGTSIYTPAFVIPMLPRTLSNGICSLLEDEDRLTLSVEMDIDKNGNVISSNIFKSVIKSKKKMTYEKVERVLKGESFKEYAPFVNDILLMRELANILKDKRMKDGSINLDIPETHFILDENGDVIDVTPYNIGESNGIIEEFMLVTNKTVAKTFCDLNAPFIYRIHEKPDIEKLREVNEVLKNMGTSIKGINKVHPKAIDTALEAFKDDNTKYMVVSKMILKTLKLAKYSDSCLGHFGLNFSYYCHFTSPIRRYPDLFIHRVISNYLESGYSMNSKDLNRLKNRAYRYAVLSSDAEKIATETERDFDDLYMARFMKKHLGDEFYGTISSVTSFGIYVKLDNTIEGLVTLNSLTDDYYIYYEKEMCLIGEVTNKKYEVGKRVKVRVDRASEEQRQIDFSIVEEL